jgi:hypothetical protein
MKISYAITVCNELEEIKRLISFLHQYKRSEDEIVVLYDNNGSKEVFKYLQTVENIKLAWDNFQNNFAEWKNKLTLLCTGDYIFQIDADELPNEELLGVLPNILSSSQSDVILTPRINIVEGITPQHLQAWGWKQNEQGWIQFPDYQWRIYKNTSSIKWKNKIHEVLDGYKTYAYLPEFEEYSLYHHKHISKQESQNNFYSKL